MFPIEDYFNPIANDGSQLGLNGIETEREGEPQPFEAISWEEFIN